jgi:hypothetical protein
MVLILEFSEEKRHGLALETALELSMQQVCKDKQWQMYWQAAFQKKAKLMDNTDELIEELRKVPYAHIAEHLNPPPVTESALDYFSMEEEWDTRAVSVYPCDTVVTDSTTLNVYGY